MELPTLIITTTATDNGWGCVTDTPLLGQIVLSHARTIQRAQLDAAKFCDANFPGYPQVWVGGYEGGETRDALPQNTYWGDN